MAKDFYFYVGNGRDTVDLTTGEVVLSTLDGILDEYNSNPSSFTTKAFKFLGRIGGLTTPVIESAEYIINGEEINIARTTALATGVGAGNVLAERITNALVKKGFSRVLAAAISGGTGALILSVFEDEIEVVLESVFGTLDVDVQLRSKFNNGEVLAGAYYPDGLLDSDESASKNRLKAAISLAEQSRTKVDINSRIPVTDIFPKVEPGQAIFIAPQGLEARTQAYEIYDGKIVSVLADAFELSKDAFLQIAGQSFDDETYQNRDYVARLRDGRSLLVMRKDDRLHVPVRKIDNPNGKAFSSEQLSFRGDLIFTSDNGSLNIDATNRREFNNYILAIGGSNSDSISGTNFGGSGGFGKDYLSGGAGGDAIRGNSGDDLIEGGSGQDTLTGGNGKDIIWGDDDSDILMGDDGDDILLGGLGDDQIDGGAGKDDVAAFKGECSEYLIEEEEGNTGVWTIEHETGRDGKDTLKNIESVRFANGSFQLKSGKKVLCGGQQVGLVIDTTGSMEDNIDAVKQSARKIVNSIFDADGEQAKSQIAIVGYKDPGDVTSILEFSNKKEVQIRKEDALSAIDGISVSGGDDIPEGVYSGLLFALQGNVGEWRDDARVRRLIVFGDAPPKDIELRETVNQLAQDLDVDVSFRLSSISERGMQASVKFTRSKDGIPQQQIGVEIFTVVIGSNIDTQTEFQRIAAENSGQVFTASDAETVVPRLLRAINPEIDFSKGKQGIRTIGTDDDDRLKGAGKIDRFRALNGDDTLIGNNQNDLLIGNKGKDELRGGGGRDFIVGGAGEDALSGGAGDDILEGGFDSDRLSGGAGNDIFVLKLLKDKNNVITDFQDGDLIDVSDIFELNRFNALTATNQFDSFVELSSVGSDVTVGIDLDGNGSNASFSKVVTLKNVSLENISILDFLL